MTSSLAIARTAVAVEMKRPTSVVATRHPSLVPRTVTENAVGPAHHARVDTTGARVTETAIVNAVETGTVSVTAIVTGIGTVTVVMTGIAVSKMTTIEEGIVIVTVTVIGIVTVTTTADGATGKNATITAEAMIWKVGSDVIVDLTALQGAEADRETAALASLATLVEVLPA